MSKLKNLLIDIESRLIGGDAYEDIITHVQGVLDCDVATAKVWVDETEGNLCMEEERNYYEDQIVLIEGFSEEE